MNFNYIKNEIVIMFKEIVSFWLGDCIKCACKLWHYWGEGVTRTFNEIVELFAT